MNFLSSRRLVAALGAGLLVLAGCGGGGGDETPAPAAPTPTPPVATTATLSGTAATGAAFDGALVTIYDRSGTAVGTTTVAVDGSYTLEIPLTVQSPLVVEATRDGETLVSAAGETRTTRINITPLTHLIAARLAPDGNPLSLRMNASVATEANLTAKVAEIRNILKPLLDAIADTVDPLSGAFSANGSGHDKVLDSIAVDIRLTGSGSNIEVTVKVAAAGTVSTSFTNSEATPPPITATIDPASLPPDNIAAMVEDITARLTACYAVPFAERVSGVTPTATAVVGTASAIISPACRTLFFGDDPATYLNNGARVGRDAGNNGAFTGIFRSGATGVVFDMGKLAFLRNNEAKDVVFSYRTTDTAGNTGFDTLVARNVAGKLKLLGNQYIYAASVRPYAQDREFLNQPAANYRSTGYDVSITNRVDTSGNPVFSMVVVTTPSGNTLTFKPNAGRTQLSIVKGDGTLSSTSVIRLAGQFKDPATSGTPATRETNLVWASPAWTEEEIRAIPEQGVWRLEFFHADSSRANVVQSYRTHSRAATLAELAATPLPQLTEAAKAEIRAESATFGVILFGPPSASSPNVADLSTSGGGDFWTVPSGAAAPTSVTLFGGGPDPDGSGPLRRPPYDDQVNVSPSARKAMIFCSPLSNADTHCDRSTGVVQYAENTTVDSLQLFAVTPRFAGLSKMSVTYYLLPR